VPNDGKLAELRKLYSGRVPIIYHGSISEDRGLLLMIRGMRILKRSHPEIVLVILGDMGERLRARAKRLISEYHLSQQVNLLGWIPHHEIVNYISVAKVGLVPLLRTKKFMKNIPLKQFEYMACGVPVLGADLPPISAYILTAGSGKVFDPASPEAFAAGVLEILSDEYEWERMSMAGRKAVHEHWNWHSMEAKLHKVYEKFTENGAPGRQRE